jgi:SAM-dependent methyltransferase
MDKKHIAPGQAAAGPSPEVAQAIRQACGFLEQGQYSDFLSSLESIAGMSKDGATLHFLGSLRSRFFRGVNSLFDEVEEFIGRDYSSLIPSRYDQFDANGAISNLRYGEEYHKSAMAWIDIHTHHSGLTPSSKVLEIGCGAGNFAYALTCIIDSGFYYGFDAAESNVVSCSKRFRIYPNYRFSHIQTSLQNYHGLLDSGSPNAPAVVDIQLPLLENYFSLQVSHSVFTHMYTEHVKNYLKQICRALKPGAISANTCFIMDGVAREQVRSGKATHPFVYEKDGFYWYWPHDPLMGNAFAIELLIGLYEEAGFKIKEPILYGTWANRNGPYYQDIVIAEKPK